MGTNFYLKPQDSCTKCKREYDEIHIGKRSAGHRFVFNPYKKDSNEWFDFIKENDGRIEDEYGRKISADDLIQSIKSTLKEPYRHQEGWENYIDVDKYGFLISKCDEFS